MILDSNLVIGPDASSCTEDIPTDVIVTLCDIGILTLCETVDHGPVTLNGRVIAHARTNIYRRTP